MTFLSIDININQKFSNSGIQSKKVRIFQQKSQLCNKISSFWKENLVWPPILQNSNWINFLEPPWLQVSLTWKL